MQSRGRAQSGRNCSDRSQHHIIADAWKLLIRSKALPRTRPHRQFQSARAGADRGKSVDFPPSGTRCYPVAVMLSDKLAYLEAGTVSIGLPVTPSISRRWPSGFWSIAFSTGSAHAMPPSAIAPET